MAGGGDLKKPFFALILIAICFGAFWQGRQQQEAASALTEEKLKTRVAYLQATIDALQRERSKDFRRLGALEASLGRVLQKKADVLPEELREAAAEEEKKVDDLSPSPLSSSSSSSSSSAAPELSSPPTSPQKTTEAPPVPKETSTPPPKRFGVETREAMRARKMKAEKARKEAEVAALKAEVASDLARQERRGYDFNRRLRTLHVPTKTIAVSASDLYSSPRFTSGLREMFAEKSAKLVVCTIEKVASSELKKLLHRMNGDPKWREEPWFKGGIPKLKFEKSVAVGAEMMNSPQWAKLVFLRHPYERLVSCYKDKFGRDNRLYSVKMTGNRSTHMLTFPEFVDLITAPGSPHQNQHWRPQNTFCGLNKYLPLFNFVGQFEKLQEHAKIYLQATDTWEVFGVRSTKQACNSSTMTILTQIALICIVGCTMRTFCLHRMVSFTAPDVDICSLPGIPKQLFINESRRAAGGPTTTALCSSATSPCTARARAPSRRASSASTGRRRSRATTTSCRPGRTSGKRPSSTTERTSKCSRPSPRRPSTTRATLRTSPRRSPRGRRGSPGPRRYCPTAPCDRGGAALVFVVDDGGADSG